MHFRSFSRKRNINTLDTVTVTGDVIDIGYDTCTYAVFQNAVYRHSVREICDFNVILFRIY